MDSPAQKHWRLLKNSFNMFAVKTRRARVPYKRFSAPRDTFLVSQLRRFLTSKGLLQEPPCYLVKEIWAVNLPREQAPMVGDFSRAIGHPLGLSPRRPDLRPGVLMLLVGDSEVGP